MAAQDDFPQYASGLGSPLSNLVAVTPSDSTDLAHVARCLYVGTAGDISVITAGGPTVTLTAALGWLPVRVSRVNATNTTATNILSGW